MKVINERIADEGLGRELVKSGFGDIILKIGKEEISAVKSILCNGSKLFSKLLKDEKLEGKLELNENISVNGYYLLERYLSGSYVDINDENVIDLLCISLFYEESILHDECLKYIGNHINEKILNEFLNFISLLNINQLKYFHIYTDLYIYRNGYKYIYGEMIYDLSINSIYYILNSEKLIINNENDLLKIIMKYNLKEKEKNKGENVENMNKLYESINWTKVELKWIEPDEKEVMKNSNINVLNFLNNNINNRIYINMNEVIDDNMKDLILRYYTNDDSVLSIKDEDMKILEKNEKLKEIINELLLNEDDIINMIGLTMIIDMKIDYEIKNPLKRNLFTKILCFYANNSNNIKRESVAKCSTVFIKNDKDLYALYSICGNELLYKLVNYINYATKEISDIILEFVKGLKYGYSFEDYEMMDVIILDNSLIESLKMIKMIEFYYPRRSYCFRPGEEISIKPSIEVKDSICVIEPDLPDGLTIDYSTGEIKGKVDVETKQKKYTIECSNIRNCLTFTLLLEIHDYQFISNYNGNFIELPENSHRVYRSNKGYNRNGIYVMPITTNKTGWYNAYVNLKMENGIYHIKYRYSGNNGSNNIMLGATKRESYNGSSLYNQSDSYCICIYNGSSSLYNHDATIVNQPGITNHTSGSEYELIFDMIKHEFSIIHDDKEILLMKDLPSVLYPFVEIYNHDTYIDLISVLKEEEEECNGDDDMNVDRILEEYAAEMRNI